MLNHIKIFKLASFAIVYLVLICRTSGQSGFCTSLAKDIPFSMDMDDIQFHNNQLYVSGTAFIDSVNLWGLILAKVDTNGMLLWKTTFHDTSLASHIVLNSPSRFLITKNQKFILPVYYYNTGKMGILITDSLGHEINHVLYDNDGLSIFPFDVIEVFEEYYILGLSQRNNYMHDVFILKVDSIGNQIWMKYYGLAPYHDEFIGDAIINTNGNITISASRHTNTYAVTNPPSSYKKPWIFTIDTSGNIVEEWIGDENDIRTSGGGPTLLMENGDWIISSFYLKNFHTIGNPDIQLAEVVSRLDSNFNLLWRIDLSSFNRTDRIRDIAYDPLLDQIIVAGEKLLVYDGEYSKEAWVIKLDSNGDIIWSITDTLYYSRQEVHFTAGLDLSPSGSIYVGGYVTVNELDPRFQGFILKVSPDGCTDTVCTTTSIYEQIKNWEQNVLLYPNPAVDELTLLIKSMAGIGDLKIYDIQGNCTITSKVSQGNNGISTTNLPNALYFYSLSSSEGKIYSGKFTIVR